MIVTIHTTNILTSNTATGIKFMKEESNFNQDKLEQAKSDADKDNAARSAQAMQEELDRDEDLFLLLRSSDGASLARAV
jgi:hypothetical protein